MDSTNELNLSKYWLTGFIFPAIVVLCSCEGGTSKDCGDGAPYFSMYTIDKYELEFEVYQPAENVYGEEPVSYEPPLAINPLDFVLILSSEISYARNKLLGFSIFPQAFACTPVTHRVALQRIVDFRITSTAGFGENFPAGTDLESLFMQVYHYGATPNSMSYYSDEPVTDAELPPQSSWHRLAAQPLEPSHIFTVTIELDDGSFYQFNSPRVTFDLDAVTVE